MKHVYIPPFCTKGATFLKEIYQQTEHFSKTGEFWGPYSQKWVDNRTLVTVFKVVRNEKRHIKMYLFSRSNISFFERWGWQSKQINSEGPAFQACSRPCQGPFCFCCILGHLRRCKTTYTSLESPFPELHSGTPLYWTILHGSGAMGAGHESMHTFLVGDDVTFCEVETT